MSEYTDTELLDFLIRRGAIVDCSPVLGSKFQVYDADEELIGWSDESARAAIVDAIQKGK